MNRDTAKRLLDALTAAGRISRYSAGRSYADYEGDDYFRSAVERQFEVLAEALNAANREDPDIAPSIPELPEIVGLRNKIAHGYDTVTIRSSGIRWSRTSRNCWSGWKHYWRTRHLSEDRSETKTSENQMATTDACEKRHRISHHHLSHQRHRASPERYPDQPVNA